MKTTLSTNEVTHALLQDDNAGWSYDGAKALAEYLDDMEVEMEEEMELDVVALRCDFSEFESLIDWANEYFTIDQLVETFPIASDPDADDYADLDDCEEEIRDYIRDNGQLIEFDGGIIVSSF
jgi:hypothetical protein